MVGGGNAQKWFHYLELLLMVFGFPSAFLEEEKKSLIVVKYDTSHSSKRLVALFCLLVYSKVVWCDWPSSECWIMIHSSGCTEAFFYCCLEHWAKPLFSSFNFSFVFFYLLRATTTIRYTHINDSPSFRITMGGEGWLRWENTRHLKKTTGEFRMILIVSTSFS